MHRTVSKKHGKKETGVARLDGQKQRSVLASQPSTSQYYRPELDVLRLLAFLLVFFYHTLPTSQDPRVLHFLKGFAPAFDAFGDACGFGLSLFFTLSAFLICELLLRERETAGTVGVKRFYIRRILRIWPLYYLGVALGIGAAFIPGGEPATAIKLGWFAIFMGAWFRTTQSSFHNPADVLWSISVEEQFYLFAPWMVKYFNRSSLYGLCLVIIVVANAWLFYFGSARALDYVIWFNSFVQFECFAGGILLCLVLRGRLPRITVWQRMVLFAFSFSCWFYACYGLHTRLGGYGNLGSWRLMLGYALATLGSVLLLVAFLGVKPKLLPRWAVYLGRISFGLYVFHDFAIYMTSRLVIATVASLKYPVVNSLKGPIYLLNMGLTLGVTVLMGTLSYRYFETPFLKMKKRLAVIESEPVGAVTDLSNAAQTPETGL
jgi:peptidoglycan/LPS O-acetylase OafA/YrhL